MGDGIIRNGFFITQGGLPEQGEAMSLLNDRTILTWKAPLRHRIYLRLMWPIWRLKARIRFALTGDCGFMCEHVEPYGFVPECGCPIHDRYPMHDEENGS